MSRQYFSIDVYFYHSTKHLYVILICYFYLYLILCFVLNFAHEYSIKSALSWGFR